MEELLASSNIDNLAEGSILKGTIVEIRPTEVVVRHWWQIRRHRPRI
jgi:ribosomal protein S1